MKNLSHKIVNVIGSSSIPRIDLTLLLDIMENSQFLQPGKQGIYYKSKAYNTTVCIFKSGKIAFRGANGIRAAKSTIKELYKTLKTAEVSVSSTPIINITNIVATFDLGTSLNFGKILETFPSEDMTYEPEQFPGLVYRDGKNGTTILIFSTGKCVVTGAKKSAQIQRTTHDLLKLFQEGDVI